MHPDANKIAGYLDKTISADERKRVELHIAYCRECLKAMTAAHESVAQFRKNKKDNNQKAYSMRKINPYLALAIAFFLFSLIIPRFFIQSLVATLVFGIKWVADSRSAKMLIMIYDAWKRDDNKGISRILDNLDNEMIPGCDRSSRRQLKNFERFLQ
ncbi:MAG: zf-HC2 domain-containing protein [Candidatus Omnitrophica bacterium]|nr:zf-HC2 domain-containing protein [Candidatus Omnitrophota bacterium]